MRKDVERILRWEDLVEKHKKLRDLTMRACRGISYIRTNCKHEVVIATKTEIVPQYIVGKKCLFCGREDINLGRLGFNTTVIHSIKSKLWLSHPAKYEVAKKLFIKFATENPDMETIEIANHSVKDPV